MRISLKSIVAPVALLFLAACASQMSGTKPTMFPGLNAELAPRYAVMAADERDESDAAAAALFAAKAANAASGFQVMPDSLSSRRISGGMAGALSDARGALMAKYDQGYAKSQPADLAAAQTSWDCWFQEQEEGYQLIHINRCKNNFMAAMKRMGKKMAAKKYTIFFRLNSSDLSNLALSQLRTAVADAMSRGNLKVMVGAHTDRAGSAAYNVKLSNVRATTVRNALVAAGIKSSAITAKGYGETQPLVKTKDGVASSRNRRAEITVGSQ